MLAVAVGALMVGMNMRRGVLRELEEPDMIEGPPGTREHGRMPLTMDSAALTFSLSRFIEDVRTVAPADGRARLVERLPDGRTALVFRELAGGQKGDVCIAGPRTRALYKNTTGLVRAVMVQFKPGWAAPLLGVPASAVTDQIIPLEDLWGRSGAGLFHELLAARSLPEVLDRLSQAVALRPQPSFEPASARLARRAVRLLERGEVRVESVAEQLGVTARHLRRAFLENIGIGPKDFARTLRLQRAVRMTETSKDWGRIAVDAGYYDQAHLIADFREFVGLTPGAFLKRADAQDIAVAMGTR
jgi:AraC-like DNA-binding protein